MSCNKREKNAGSSAKEQEQQNLYFRRRCCGALPAQAAEAATANAVPQELPLRKPSNNIMEMIEGLSALLELPQEQCNRRGRRKAEQHSAATSALPSEEKNYAVHDTQAYH
eukprot:1158409-Pelagomonas_calceolata.AAC.1